MADEIGSLLREARMRAKIDINEVETRTKIRAKYLRAIENEEWDLLPGEVYVKSFLRTYSEYLGLDSRQILDDFRRRHERPSDHELRPITPLGRERDRPQRRRGVPPWAIIGVVLIAVVAALYLLGKHHGATNPKTSSTSAQTTNRPKGKPGAARRRRRPVAARPTKVKLQLVATGAVWVCLVDGNGKKLIDGQSYDIGQTIPTESAGKLLLLLGNNNVKMKVNGKSVAVTASPGAIGYRLTPTQTSSLTSSEQPQCT